MTNDNKIPRIEVVQGSVIVESVALATVTEGVYFLSADLRTKYAILGGEMYSEEGVEILLTIDADTMYASETAEDDTRIRFLMPKNRALTVVAEVSRYTVEAWIYESDLIYGAMAIKWQNLDG